MLILFLTGYTGGSDSDHTGAAVDFLCLPEDPEWDNYDDSVRTSSGARVYGGEYQTGQDLSILSPPERNTLVEDAPCAVCWIERGSVLIIPGKLTCPAGWSKEYSGYLAAGDFNNIAASEYVCLDKEFELIPGGEENLNGKLFYIAEAICGSLPCEPYVNGRELTCVVCSK